MITPPAHPVILSLLYHFITVLSFISSCPHCDRFHDEIRHHGYKTKTVPTETDANGKILRTLLDLGIPLITCSCSECEVPREVAQLLRSSTMPDSWNVLDVTDTNGDNGNPVNEVLDWLNSIYKLPRRSSTASADGQQG